MIEEEFLKEHPSLKGMIIEIPLKLISIGDCAGITQLINIATIHETQIDKIKHKEILDKREHTHQINLQCARDGAIDKYKQKVKDMIIAALELANERIVIEGQAHPDNLSAYIDLDFKKVAEKELGLQ